ncbi:MAG: HlyD family efflux transporter periplasmic adaptor subunit [Pirellulaceae bacterium]|nr:HlyD family efflux transporter periplasmic adaptor subunit [Pirellulaceae bacterium]
MTTKMCSRAPFFVGKMTVRQKMTLWLIAVILLSGGGVAIGMLKFDEHGRQTLLHSESPQASVPAVSLESGKQSGSEPSSGEALDAKIGNHPNVAATGKRSGQETAYRLPTSTALLGSLQPTTLAQRFPGVVKARRSSLLASKLLGKVTKVSVDLGHQVQAGQVLAELDNRELLAERDALVAQLSGAEARLSELRRGPRAQEIEKAQAQVRESEAMLALRKANADRVNQLIQSSSISKQERDESATALHASQAQLDNANKTLELLEEGTRAEQLLAQEATVRSLQAQIEKVSVLISDHLILAPFGGHVKARFVDEGVVVSPGQAILEVAETEQLEVHVGLPADLVSPQILGAARIWCEDLSLPARLSRLSPVIDQRTRNVQAVFSLPSSAAVPTTAAVVPAATADALANCQLHHRVGQAIELEIEVPVDRGGWWVPSSALVSAGRGLWSLLIARPEEQPATTANAVECTAQACQVELLRTTGRWSQVQGTLSDDDLLIVSGVHRLTAGQKVLSQLVEPLDLEFTQHAVAGGGDR